MLNMTAYRSGGQLQGSFERARTCQHLNDVSIASQPRSFVVTNKNAVAPRARLGRPREAEV